MPSPPCVRRLLSLGWIALAALTFAPRGAAQPAGFADEPVVSGLDNACALAQAPDGRFFILERLTGNVRVVSQGQLLPNPWATIPDLEPASAFDERGLLGIAIDPDFTLTGDVYLYYTRNQLGPGENVIVRYRDVAGQGQGPVDLLTGIPANNIHNGGMLAFGLDMMLYAATGEASIPGNAMDLTSLGGKVLRIDRTGSIPPDNPFVGTAGARGELFSLGHRNQYGLAIHPVTGVPFNTENGSTFFDEIDRIVAGGNYGWPLYEGPEPIPDPLTEDPLTSYSPIVAPAGSTFYMGEAFGAAYRDNYFYTTWKPGQIHRMVLSGPDTSVVSDGVWCKPTGTVFDITVGHDGALYYLGDPASLARGARELRRIRNTAAPFPGINATGLPGTGGYIVLGITGNPGDAVTLFLGAIQLVPPFPTPWGNLEVAPPLITIPLTPIPQGGVLSVPLELPSGPNAKGATLFAQAAVGLAPPALTNLASFTIR